MVTCQECDRHENRENPRTGPLDERGRVLQDSDLAEAIIDRVLERGRLAELRGSSFRTRHLRRLST